MKIAILGFGREGLSAYKYWSSPENTITIHDNNPEIILPSGVDGILGVDAFKNIDKYGYDLLVRSPGLRIESHSLKTPCTTPTNEFLKVCPATVVGVTGTKGKGTTSTLISKILTQAGYKTHLLGNIGSPALDALPDISKDDIVVYEMSSFQLYDIKVSPHVAVCLMVSEDHLDWHNDLDEYRQSKRNIFKYQKSDDIAVYYSDNSTSVELAMNSRAKYKYSYGKDSDVTIVDGRIKAFGEDIISEKDVLLPGEHNLQNISAAIAACHVFTKDIAAINEVLKTFKGLPYHIELVKEKDGIKYYNDSFSTNPSAAIAAIRSFDKPQVLFLGGYDRGSNFEELAQELKSCQIRTIICFGQSGPKIEAALIKAGLEDIEYVPGNDFNKIIQKGIGLALEGDCVVFSPACPSYDMFKDYIDRGNTFNDALGGISLE